MYFNQSAFAKRLSRLREEAGLTQEEHSENVRFLFEKEYITLCLDNFVVQ